MEIDNILKKSLQNINFCNRYESLVEKYSYNYIIDKNFIVDNDDITNLALISGYILLHNKEENFLYTKTKKKNFEFQFNIVARGYVLSLVWGVTKSNERLYLSWGELGSIYSAIKNENFTKKVCIQNKEDIEQVVKFIFELYEDFMREVLNINYNDFKLV